MKKKIINGILLVAMLFATTSAFVSCKDTDADYKSETDAKIAKLQSDLASLQTLVSSIKSCNCDMTSINNKLAALEAAINAIKVPDLNGYLKTADLPDAVKALLADYYTKAEIDALIKGINIPEGLTEAQVKGLIEEALKDYVKKGEEQGTTIVGLDEAAVKKLIEDALKDYVKKGEEQTSGLDEAAVKKLIEDALKDALKDYVKTADLPTVFTKEEIIDIIKETITVTEADVTVVYLTEVTSLNVDQVVNPMFSFMTPFGVESNVLLAYFGDKAKRDLYFPKGAEEPIVYKGEYIMEGLGNAGKIYVTVNPSSVDFSGKTLNLVTTGGDESPVELTPLKASNENLMYLKTNTRGDNAFYETYATIPAEKLGKAFVSWEPENMEDFKEQIVELFKGHENNKQEIVEMIRTIYNLVINNDIPAYRLQATWGDKGYKTYSQTNIAAVAIKPLSYAFDLSDEAQYDGEAITALEKLESKAVKVATKTASTQAKIWRFLDRFNIYADKAFQNINWAIQPTLLIATGDEVSHPNVYSEATTFTRYDAGEVTLLPTSWSAEALAPAFKKLVVITNVEDGTPVNGDLLGKVLPGSVKEIPFTIESGKTYKIQYSAMDYEGNIRTLSYIIKGNVVYE
jgi:hypothetical protein